jgi:hypothetical protein
LKKSNKYIVLVFLMCLLVPGSAQEEFDFETEEAIAIDRVESNRTSPQTKLTEQDWEAAKRGLDYGTRVPEEPEPAQEDADTQEEDTGPSWFENLMDDLSKISVNQKLLSAILIGVVILLLVWLIVKLVVHQQKTANPKLSPAELTFALKEAEENLEESDLDRLLRISLEHQDYKSAVRIYYLAVLKNFTSLGLIAWKKDKTNADYLAEMRLNTKFDHFKIATITYERVWYGDLEISQQDHDNLRPLFYRILNETNNG